MSGLLAVAAELAAEELQKTYGLEGEEHKAALTSYIYGLWGEMVHHFLPMQPPSLSLIDLPSYLSWKNHAHEDD